MGERISADEIRARMAKNSSRSVDRWLDQAAVWMQMDLGALTLDGSPTTPQDQAKILADCVAIPRRGPDNAPLPPLWTLRQAPRIAALARLYRRPDGVAAALTSNSHEMARPENALFADLLLGKVPNLEELPVPRIQAIRDAILLLSRIPGFPYSLDTDMVERELAKQHLLGPFRALTASFVGRDAELTSLRSYVDVVASEGVFESAWRLVDRVTRSKRPAFVIHGTGGVGKSTLLAKFLLDHAREEELCFAYLDLERYELSEGRPEAVCQAALEQLRLFHPSHGSVIRQGLNAVQVTPDTWWRSAPSGNEVLVSALRAATSAKKDLYAAVLGTVIAKVAEGKPALLVFDTFEVFQTNGNFAKRLSRFLSEVQDLVPLLRVVISGRAPAPDLILAGSPPRELMLRDLGTEAGVALLQKKAEVDPERARTVVMQVGSNPLTLVLAARLLKADPSADLTEGAGLWDRLTADRMQGFLYTRVLARIDDERVRKVAHPGMVLRKLNRAVLQGILDIPCELDLMDDADADGLLTALRTEVSLIAVDSDGSLRFRSDLRVLAVPLLTRDQAKLVHRIHQEAVAFYRSKLDPVCQSEHLYHLLALGDLNAADALPADIDVHIGNEISLLPPASQAWLLATRRHVTRISAAQVSEMMDKGDFEAVVLASEANPQLETQVPVLVAQALYWTGRTEQARGVATRAVARGVGSDDLRRLLALIGKHHDHDAYRETAEHAVEALTDFLGDSMSANDVGQVLTAARGGVEAVQVAVQAVEARVEAKVEAPQAQAPRRAWGGFSLAAHEVKDGVKNLAKEGLIDADFFGRLRAIVPARASDIDVIEDAWVNGTPTSKS